MRARAGECKHFNGIHHATCEQGVSYAEMRRQGEHGKLPCLRPMQDGEQRDLCPLREEPTAEDLDRQEAMAQAFLKTLQIVMAALRPIRAEYRGRDGAGQIPCPLGCGGMLSWSLSGLNGRMHVRCTTQGCIWWKE